MEDQKEKKLMWIIRFSDNSLRSHYGTRTEAEKIAKELCVLRGGSYIIA